MGHVCYLFQTRTKLVCRPAASCRGVQNITIFQKRIFNILFDRSESMYAAKLTPNVCTTERCYEKQTGNLFYRCWIRRMSTISVAVNFVICYVNRMYPLLLIIRYLVTTFAFHI